MYAKLQKVPQGRFGWIFFWWFWDLVEDNSVEKPFVAILSRSIHIMPELLEEGRKRCAVIFEPCIWLSSLIPLLIEPYTKLVTSEDVKAGGDVLPGTQTSTMTHYAPLVSSKPGSQSLSCTFKGCCIPNSNN